jgi:hypothetical protein
LESSEHNLRLECDRLKEVSDVARNQIAHFEARRNADNAELTALRAEVLQLEAASDARAEMGQLHRQLAAHVVREAEHVAHVETLTAKLARAEAHNFRINRSEFVWNLA